MSALSTTAQYEANVDREVQAEPAQRELLKFRLMDGQHCENLPNKRDAKGNPILVTYRKGAVIETYTDLNRLNAKMEMNDGRVVDDPNFPKKFERIYDDPHAAHSQQAGPITAEEAARRGFATAFTDKDKYPPTPAQPPQVHKDQSTVVLDVNTYVARLEKMSVKELQAHAAEEEVDLKGAANKEQIIKVLRAGYSA